MSTSTEESLWAGSSGDCRPASNGQVVTGGIYDSLVIPSGVTKVSLDGPIVLADTLISSRSTTGFIYVPQGTTNIQLGGCNVEVHYKSWEELAELAWPV